MTDHSPRERLAAGYAESTPTAEERRNARKAGAYRPEHDAEADRLKTTRGRRPADAGTARPRIPRIGPRRG